MRLEILSKSFRCLFLLQLISVLGYSQIQPGSWREHLSFNYGISLTQGSDKIFCATPTGIFSYAPANGGMQKITKLNGLTSTDISTIEYILSKNCLVVGYDNGNIDLVYSDRVKTIPDIKNKFMQGSKRINHVYFYNNVVYVSTDFGIVLIDADKLEVKDTYYIGTNGDPSRVNSTIIYQNRIYAATIQGLLSADINDPILVDYTRWNTESGFSNPNNECLDLTIFQQKLIALERNSESEKDIIWEYDQLDWIQVGQPFNTLFSARANNNRLLVTSDEGIAIYSSLSLLPTFVGGYGFASDFQPQMAISFDDDGIAIADKYFGLIVGRIGYFYQVCPNGPLNNNVFSIGVSENRIIVAAGAYDAAYTNRWLQYSYHTFVDQSWKTNVDWQHHDAVRVVFNPNNSNEYFIGSWGHGVFRYQGDQLKNQYNQDNSTLQTIYPGQPYCRVSGMTFDDKGNLWVANPMVQNSISVRRRDTSWVGFPYYNQINSDRFSDLHYSPNGNLWLILPSGEGFFVLDPGEDISSITDDHFKKIKPVDRYGNALPSDINAITFDRDGYLWVATTQGVLVSYNSDKIFDNTTYFQKVKIPDIVPGLAAYLLETESVTSLCVDGGNRKWFGTAKSGVFLQASDGSQEILHFTSQNSPLLSDNILDIKIHPTTGEVFIISDKGLVSFRGVATQPKDTFKKVYVYPNPVRPNYNGEIIISGLVENTTVKITDVAGNLVYETISLGGQAVWDGKNLNGNKVTTGVYLVFCSNKLGDQTAVTKLLFVK